jgi:hypothetical protein
MRAIERLLFAASIAAVFAGPARAQDAPQWELGAFGGGFFGSRISLTPAEATLISSGATFGLRGAFETAPHFRLQASFSTADVRILTRDPLTGARLAPDAPGHVRTYELDWIYGFGQGRLRGFAGLGAGAMTLPALQTGATAGGNTRFTTNIVLGGEYFLTDRLAAVLEGRYRWTETGQRLGTIVCESKGCEPFLTNLFSSAEATAGFSYRFGDVRPFPADPIADVAADDGTHRYPGTAAAEVFLFELLPWAVNRYISEADYAYVTADSIKAGFRTGFTYDRDVFSTNVFNHPIHGNMYYSSARSNGYGFWESGAVTLLGSFLWECCAESEPPAINDLVNTTLGGMVNGEVTYRLSSMLWAGGGGDGGAGPSLAERVGAIVLSPVGALNRALHGEDAQLPRAEAVPSRFHLDLDAGYLHIGNGAQDPDRGGLALRAWYGDPFAGEMRKPFDAFSLAVEMNAPAESVLTRIELQGILKGWDLSEAKASSRYIFGLFMGYAYVNNDVETYGTESFSAGFLSRYRLGRDFVAEGALLANVYPLAAIKNVDGPEQKSTRDYDFGSGGGLSIAGRLMKADCEIATLTYGVAWTDTANGVSTSNTLQYFRAAARLPIADGFGAGASYSLYRRQTSYASLPSQSRTQPEWGAFLSWRP